MAFLYFVILLVLIILGSLTRDFNYVQLAVLPMGLIAVLFQKFIHKKNIKKLGFQRCRLKQAAKAFIFPVVIICLVFVIDLIFGLIKSISLDRVENPYQHGEAGVKVSILILMVIITALLTFVAVLVTEELGFRGYLLTRLEKLGHRRALIYSSLLFGVWHLPPSLILIGSGLERSMVYVFNIFLLGILFGSLFMESRSLIPPSVFHGVWNALEYTLFGYGNFQAVFMGNSRILYDPEEGLVGTAILMAFAFIVLFRQGQSVSPGYFASRQPGRQGQPSPGSRRQGSGPGNYIIPNN